MNKIFAAKTPLLFLSLIMLLIIILGPSLPISAQEGDAIAIQIRPNPQHYSALRWYIEDQQFTGSPQVLKVDGYEAIRDGRTVYVNAGNYEGTVFYSNIYLLSYSQDSDPGTSDVFAQMLKHWTFNTNLIAPADSGTCSLSTLTCVDPADCKDGYTCGGDFKCHLVNEPTCWRDRDCPEGLFCTSRKAEITRRTLRYANLVDMKVRIMNYRSKHGRNPELLSGSYLPGISLSTWPSWNDSLAKDVDGGQFPLDPLNIMGACSGYDPKTCWNEETKSFFGGNASNALINRPVESSFYGYFPGVDNPGAIPDVPGQIYSFSPDGLFSCPLNNDACN